MNNVINFLWLPALIIQDYKSLGWFEEWTGLACFQARTQTEYQTRLKPFSLVFHFKLNKQYNINSVNNKEGESFTINLLIVLLITVTTKPRNALLMINYCYYYYFCWRPHKHPYLWVDTWVSLTVCFNLKNSFGHCVPLFLEENKVISVISVRHNNFFTFNYRPWEFNR